MLRKQPSTKAGRAADGADFQPTCSARSKRAVRSRSFFAVRNDFSLHCRARPLVEKRGHGGQGKPGSKQLEQTQPGSAQFLSRQTDASQQKQMRPSRA